MRFLIALAAALALISSPALAQNAASNSTRVQGVKDGFGDPVQVTIVGADGSDVASTAVAGTVASLATDTGNPVKVGCVFVSAGVGVATGQRVDLQCNNTGYLRTSPSAGVSGGATPFRIHTGTTGVIKSSNATLYEVVAINTNAAARYLHFYNKATAPTLSTDTPVLTVYLPATAQVIVPMFDIGSIFATGLSWAYTTDNTIIPTTAATSGELSLSVSYK